jgi:glycerophosphoryl diester phosphodiesterase
MAHRGGAAWEPNLGKENTARAFRAAVGLGYRYIETDVQASADGHLVCFHDQTMERLTGVIGQIGDFSSAELSQVSQGGEPLAFFDAVVDELTGVRFNVDLKTDASVEPLVAAIAAHRLADRILVVSFSQARLSRFRALTAGRVPTAMAPPGAAWTAFLPGLPGILSSPGVAWQVPLELKVGPIRLSVVNPASVARVHRLGKAVHVWTIDDPAEMQRLIDLGVDGIVTDRPDLLKQVLLDNHLWEGES